MAGGFIGQLVEAIMHGPEGAETYASMSILGLDPTDVSGSTVLLPERTFQFWPESIADSIEVGWQFKDTPGSTHSIAQWGGNSGRTITFEVRLHRFMKPVKDRTFFDKAMDPFGLTKPDQTGPKDLRRHNVDIEDEIRYLRAFCYPSYGVLDNASVAYHPPIAMLCVPGVNLNEDGSNVIMAVVTSCDVTYTLLFPNGKPRYASVSMSFKQIVQSSKGVMWKGIGNGGELNTYRFKAPDGSHHTIKELKEAGHGLNLNKIAG